MGEHISNDLSLKTHIDKKSQSINGLLQMVYNVCHDPIIKAIHYEAALKMYGAVVLPKLLYGSETWTYGKTLLEKIENIQYKCLKRILNLPKSTPHQALLLDTGIQYLETKIDEKKLLYLHKILNYSNDRLPIQIYNEQKQLYSHIKLMWYHDVHNTLDKYNINNSDTEIANHHPKKWKAKIEQNTNNMNNVLFKFKSKNKNECIKTKILDIFEHKTEPKLEKYLTKLPSHQARAVFMTRFHMLPIKANYKAEYTDLTCKFCNATSQTTKHIIEECNISENFSLKWCEVTNIPDDDDEIKQIGVKCLNLLNFLRENNYTKKPKNKNKNVTSKNNANDMGRPERIDTQSSRRTTNNRAS